MKTVYIAISADILHHGHINLIKEASKNGNAGLKIESNLIVHDDNNNYTEEVLEIFNNN